MKLIITRHGETIENVNKVCQGHLGGNLSKQGKLQAKKLAERLKEEKIDLIYSSDLKRAKDTTREIAKYHKGITIFFDKRIRERYFGKYQGSHYDKDWAWRSIAEDPNGTIEDDLRMCERISDFLNEIMEKHEGKNVLVVSHGGIKKLLFNKIFNKYLNDSGEVEVISNTSLSVFEIGKDKKVTPLILNCTKHLDK